MLLGLIIIVIEIPIVAAIFILAQRKEEIWNNIEFKEDEKSNSIK